MFNIFLSTSAIQALQDQINLIDSNVKFTISMFSTTIGIAIAIAFASLLFWAKSWFKKKVNKELSSMKEKYDQKFKEIEEEQKSLKKELSFINYQSGQWSPTFNGYDSKEDNSGAGAFLLFEKSIVLISFCTPIPGELQNSSIEPLFISGIPFASSILLSSDISVIYKNGEKKIFSAIPCDSLSTRFYLTDSENHCSPLSGTLLSEISVISGTLSYKV